MPLSIPNPIYGPREGSLTLRPEHFGGQQVELHAPVFPAEWAEQSGVQLTWPHPQTDWASMLTEVSECFTRIAHHIAQREILLIAAPDTSAVQRQIEKRVDMANVRLLQCPTNDTWARDHAALTVMDGSRPHLLDFGFNGWGGKFPAQLDNQVTRHAYEAHLLHGTYHNHLDFVLEGGSVESDGAGTLLTTASCLLTPTRNPHMSRRSIEDYLRTALHLQRVLWIENGHLEGDDTDGHIDTLARFCPDNTIAYVRCTDTADTHYHSLRLMEEELTALRTADGRPYRLLPLPMPQPIIAEGERLPATYANFLIMNTAVLYPTYGQPHTDGQARDVLTQAFPDRDIIGIDCQPLIHQHGSLHCVTMQYPKGVLK